MNNRIEVERQARRVMLPVFIWRVENGWYDGRLLSVANDQTAPLQVRLAAKKRHKEKKRR